MSYKKLNIVVVGATGYVGLDLILLLSKHPHVSIKYLCAQKNLGKKIQFFDKRIKKKLPLISNLNKVLWHKVDVLFLSLPDGEAQKLVNQLYTKHKHLKFIDLSGDFRISNINEYFKWYSIKHSAKNFLIACALMADLHGRPCMANPNGIPDMADPIRQAARARQLPHHYRKLRSIASKLLQKG